MEDNVEEPHNLGNFTRESCITKSIGHPRFHRDHASGEPSRRKKKSKPQRSCNCQENLKKAPSAKTRNACNVEAALENVEHVCNDSFKNGGLKKSQSTPLSPKSAPRCHCKAWNNCHRQQQREIEKHEKFRAILNDIVENGVVNEQMEYCDNYLNPASKRVSTKEDDHWKYNQLSQDDTENDYCTNKCTENHHRSKKNEALEEMNFVMKFKKKEDEWIEDDDERRLLRELREERVSTNKLPVTRSNSKPPKGLQNSMTTCKKNAAKQKNNKNVHRVEANHRCVDDETDDEFLLDEELRKELENIPYSKPYRKFAAVRNVKLAKSFESMDHGDRNLNERSEEPVTAVKADQPNSEDLDLHASKSHILNLIDRALSKEFGPLDEKKNDEKTKEEDVTRQEPCIEISRVLQGDCCHSLTQTLFNHSGTSDYVKHLKTLRWKYLNHIQDKLKKLYDLEKILDDCSSPTYSLPTPQSRTTNKMEQLKHCSRSQTPHQQEQKEPTS